MQASIRLYDLNALWKQATKSLKGCFYRIIGKKISSFSKKRCHGTYDTTTVLKTDNINLVPVSTIGGIA